ncbi:hypothetical protein E2C01_040636 [Portunus trituberculatus]|uniref:Uncharacterized protein n=1 Tax=Portunus trituberculatus TaxID=210409 RepID=A0A5B7FN58_PORTR|nr:hypothetical protein [Portunus trituberculatus]
MKLRVMNSKNETPNNSVAQTQLASPSQRCASTFVPFNFIKMYFTPRHTKFNSTQFQVYVRDNY